VQRAFGHLLNLVPRRGLVVAGLETPALREILPRAHCPVETFGLSTGADWRAVDIQPSESGWRFRLLRKGRDVGEFSLSIPGEHNLRNALAALAAAAAAGVEPERAREGLAAFRGVKRRLEVRGRARGVVVYDDFAHHPTAVRETLRALRASLAADPRPGRLVAVFEPRSYTSRTRVFQEEFARAFQDADRVVVAAAHLPAKVPEGHRLSETELVGAIAELGKDARFIASVDEIVRRLGSELREGDQVVILSNGGFGGIHEKLLRALQAPPPA
jgi:UDP-N-acetylmuramate: L-alanyl-gamma-D-glutamyl-meso-diaminopimelate ligase